MKKGFTGKVWGWLSRFRGVLRRARRAAAPGRRAWRGATWGAFALLAVILIATAVGMFGQTDLLWFALGTPLFLVGFLLVGGVMVVAARLLRTAPLAYLWALYTALPVLGLMALIASSVALGVLLAGLGLLACASLLGAGIASWARGRGERPALRNGIAAAGVILGAVGLIGGGAWLLDDGAPQPAAMAADERAVPALDLPDPAMPGPFTVRTATYGSGQDRRRPEYGVEADWVTQPVDGSALIEGWTGLRTRYWGFGPDALPLNGRVWIPEGEGPYPLALILHGQHPMEDDSDVGYAYLGELLASRGFLAASVDENFLNLSPLVDYVVASGLKEEDDLRGWLLLEHLQAWRAWNGTAGHPLHGKVDLERVALIGHSRGGEAVTVAAAFNRLPCWPDDASLRFDYGFGIRAVVGLAPVDGMVEPGGKGVTLQDVSYLVLHGAHDMDVFTFHGRDTYERARLGEGGDAFKAGWYIYGANHGQFNTAWGRKDLFEPLMRVFNLAQLLPGEAQRGVAQAAVGAFLEATLHGEEGYRSFFQDPARGAAWLPETPIVSQYQDAATQAACTYEEDADLTTGTASGVRLSGEGLFLWREGRAPAKAGRTEDGAVTLAWEEGAGPAAYRVAWSEWSPPLSAGSTLVFEAADAALEGPAPGPIDLTIEVVDAAGQTARLPLSRFALLRPQVEATLGKGAFMSVFPRSEAVFQHVECPLAAFVAANPGLDPAALREVRLVFDRTPAGAILVDDVGVRP